MTGPTLHINDRKQIKRMKSLICLALLFLALSVRGQGITLTGNVRDGKDQLALQDVNVVISSQGHKDITAYTISDQKGSFRLTYTPAKDKEYVIRFSYLGYETVVLNIEKSITQYNVAFIIRKTKCFDFWERNVLFPKTKRSFFRTPKHPLPCPFPLNFSLLIITKKFGNLAKNRYICIV